MAGFTRERVVVPFDFTESSLTAMRVAREMVVNAAHLYVVHVQTALIGGEDERTTLKRLEQALIAAGFDGARPQVVTGEPASGIVRHAERVGADLIVIPSHGRSGLQRILLGSVAEDVVRNATCPVLVLRRVPK